MLFRSTAHEYRSFSLLLPNRYEGSWLGNSDYILFSEQVRGWVKAERLTCSSFPSASAAAASLRLIAWAVSPGSASSLPACPGATRWM